MPADEQLDFPIIYASAIEGYAKLNESDESIDMNPLFETILQHVEAPSGDIHAPLQFQISALDYSSYTGRMGIGRIKDGVLKPGMNVSVLLGDKKQGVGKINEVFGYKGLDKVAVSEAEAGDIVIVTGIDDIGIGVTLADPSLKIGLPVIPVDEPTLTMDFMVNTSPLAGKEGKFVTSRQIRDRLTRELMTNVALRVEDTDDADIFRVSGRGELHLTILLENMRREGFEIAVGKPQVVYKEIDGIKCEPYENLTVDIEDASQGAIMEELGRRKGELADMQSDGFGRTRLDYKIPARGLIGFQGEFLTLTKGTGIMSHVFEEYASVKAEIPGRRNGVLISSEKGDAVAYALWKLQDRGRMFVHPGDILYEGMVIGIHSRDNDLIVNPIKGKQLTNVRSSGTDEAVRLVPPIRLSLEYAVEFIDDDELVEITPKSMRIRKRFLLEHERKRANKKVE